MSLKVTATSHSNSHSPPKGVGGVCCVMLKPSNSFLDLPTSCGAWLDGSLLLPVSSYNDSGYVELQDMTVTILLRTFRTPGLFNITKSI